MNSKEAGTSAASSSYPSQALRPCALQDTVRVPRAHDDDHLPGPVGAPLLHHALVHGLVPRRGHGVVDLREHVHLYQQHDVGLRDIAVLLRDGPGLLSALFGCVAEELENLVGDRAGAEARDDEGDPGLQREARPVEEHRPDDVDVPRWWEEHAEEDPREGDPRPEGVQQVAWRGEHREAQATPEPVQVYVDASARDVTLRRCDLCGQELPAHLHGKALDHPVKDADAREHQGASLTEPPTQSSTRVGVRQDLELC
mmetsp:Transcript_137862/g.344137  ORF Transcript_137862/g.344137 Transcript_137862/m.344137 type:complete len:256 (+) Transcript_137862:257-1024(+)